MQTRKVWTVAQGGERHVKAGVFATHTVCGKICRTTYVKPEIPQMVTCPTCYAAVVRGLDIAKT